MTGETSTARPDHELRARSLELGRAALAVVLLVVGAAPSLAGAQPERLGARIETIASRGPVGVIDEGARRAHVLLERAAESSSNTLRHEGGAPFARPPVFSGSLACGAARERRPVAIADVSTANDVSLSRARRARLRRHQRAPTTDDDA